jgi:hypothetical protein
VILQSGIAWQHYDAIILLLAHGFGVQGLVLCKTLFEVVLGTLYLMKNPILLGDFTDDGKLRFYEQCLAADVPSAELAKFARECKAIKARKKSKFWHGKSIEQIAADVDMDFFYQRLYRYACSVTHADAAKTLTRGSQGWRQNLKNFLDEGESPILRYSSFVLTGYFLLLVNQQLKMGNNKEADALSALIAARGKAAAMPN